MLETWKVSADKTDLNRFIKDIDCLDQRLLIAKQNASRLMLPALKLIHNYLPNREQRMKINSS